MNGRSPRRSRDRESATSSNRPKGSPDDRGTVPPPVGVIAMFVVPIVLLILWALLIR